VITLAFRNLPNCILALHLVTETNFWFSPAMGTTSSLTKSGKICRPDFFYTAIFIGGVKVARA
jgi:hypothetical protein